MIPWTAVNGIDPTVPDPTPLVARQVFPADVTWGEPQQQLRKVVVYITDGEVWCWRESGGRVELFLRREYELDTAEIPPLALMNVQPARLVTAGGPVTVRRMVGCGCGTTLQRFLPWAPIRHGN